MSPFLLSQILAGLALCSDIVSFQLKKRAHILLCFIISCLLLSIHFICLDHWTAAGLALPLSVLLSVFLPIKNDMPCSV